MCRFLKRAWELLKDKYEDAEKFNFYLCNLILPLILPLIVSIGLTYVLVNKLQFNLIFDLTKTFCLFLVISFFTNVGYWGWKGKGNYVQSEVSKKINSSLLLGILALILYILIIIIEKTGFENNLLLAIFLTISILLVIPALRTSFNNPRSKELNIKEEKDKSSIKENKEIKTLETTLFGRKSE